MQETELLEIKGKLISGVFALTSRTLLLQIISFAATFILTILLSPSAFGVFFVVSAVISFLTYFSDIGFAAALIQKKEEPTRSELVTVFTIQTVLVGILVVFSLLISGYIGDFYHLEAEGMILLKALLISFFLSSLKTIPSVLLERKLDFKMLVIPQILETAAFYGIAIIAAYAGKGIESFAWAALARGIIGLLSLYYIAPWKIAFGFSLTEARHLMRFGVPFQLNSILALIKDDLMTIVLGKWLPFSQLGYIGWAKKWAEAPLRLIMDSIIRVTFPAYARLQSDTKLLASAIEKSMFFLSLFIFPVTILLVLFIHPMIEFIPKYTKWEPALTVFYLFAFSSVFAGFSSPIVNALNAVGKIRNTLYLMVLWTSLTWILVPLFVLKFGYNGVGLAAFCISFTGLIPIIFLRRIMHINIIPVLRKPAMAAVLMATIAFIGLQISSTIVTSIVVLCLSVGAYMAIVKIWMMKEIAPFLPKFIRP